MKVLSVMRAESVSALRLVGGDFGYAPFAIAALKDKYGFLASPTNEQIAKPEPNTGLLFSRGQITIKGRLIAIDYFQLYPAGLGVTTHSNTSDSDLVLEEILLWAKERFKLSVEYVKPGIGHSSQLEVRLEKPLPQLFPFLSSVGSAITDSLDQWWGFRPQYELININFYHDKTKYPALSPPPFRLDRRENVPLDQEVYYAEAPMSTQNHVKVLERLERACLEQLQKK